MLIIPVFAPWRTIWDAALGEETLKLDDVVRGRRRGRGAVPTVPRELIEGVASDRVQSVLNADVPRSFSETARVLRDLRPLIEAAVWPRWLMLESALEEA